MTAIVGAAIALHDARVEARAKAQGILDRFTTTAALIKGWPEIEPFIPVNPDKAAQVPALISSELNALFKLPVSDKGQK